MLVGWLCGGRRVHVFGRRVHHGLAGAVLVVAGVLLMWDDAHDWPWRLLEREGC